MQLCYILNKTIVLKIILVSFCNLKRYSSMLINTLSLIRNQFRGVNIKSLPRNTLRTPPIFWVKIWFCNSSCFETLLNTFQMPNMLITSRTNNGVLPMLDFTRNARGTILKLLEQLVEYQEVIDETWFWIRQHLDWGCLYFLRDLHY